MRILIVSNGYPPTAFGGVEVNTLELAREFKRRGHTVAVICRESDKQRPDYEVIRDVHEEIPVMRVVNDYKQLTSFRQLYVDAHIDAIFANLLDEFQPDVVHFNHFLALSATLPHETARRGIATVATVHDYWILCERVNLINSQHAMCPGPMQGGDCFRCLFVNPGEPGRIMRLLKKILPFHVRVWLRKLTSRPGTANLVFSAVPADLPLRYETFRTAMDQVQEITVPSQFVRSMLVNNGYSGERIKVVPLGIGLTQQARHAPTTGLVRFGFVGSIMPLKGLESLVRAFRAVSGENIRLDIYGREDIKPVFSGQVRALAAGDLRITFHGSFAPDQRNEVYAGMDVFVMPSVWHETFSFVAREALLAGVPVIAARVGALPEVVSEDVNGFLYPPGDEPALSKIIEQIALDPEQLNHLQTPGPLEILSISESVDRLERCYMENYQLIRNLSE